MTPTLANAATPVTRGTKALEMLIGRERAQRALGLIFAAAVAALFGAQSVLADATPVELVLLYMPNVSNSGTPNASGIAELVLPEGEVRINTANLPRLNGEKQYVAWVVNTSTNQFQRLGAFNTAESTGAVRYETVLPDAIPNKHWNLLLVTIEDSATPAEPSAKHSIAGVFPSADNASLPGVLPNTGGDPDTIPTPSRPDWLSLAGPVALLSAVTGIAGYALGIKRR